MEKVQAVARKIVRAAAHGQPLVVVVSAMGDTTSELIGRARQVSPTPPRRELDVLLSSGERMSMALLAMAIEEQGRSAISLSGPQAGIITDDEHANATILNVRPERVLEELDAGNIVTVAGYQGLSTAGEVTTLGRGGSDTTAVALAAALRAGRCEIYSDVPGVYSADPRMVDKPMHLERVDAELMTEYARRGARVLHPTCIELADRHGIPVHALSTFGDGRHTIIAGHEDLSESAALDSEGVVQPRPAVLGVTSREHRVRMVGKAHGRRALERAVEGFADPDDILRGQREAQHDWLLDVGDIPDAEGFVRHLEQSVSDVASITDELASVSFVADAALIQAARGQVSDVLEDAHIAVSATYTRPLSITCAIEAGARREAVRALHDSLIEQSLTVEA